jgi:hypothetical protein
MSRYRLYPLPTQEVVLRDQEPPETDCGGAWAGAWTGACAGAWTEPLLPCDPLPAEPDPLLLWAPVLPWDPEPCDPLLCAPLFAEPLVARLAEPDPEPPDETAALERAECPNTAKSTAAPTIPADPTVAVSLRTRRSPSSRAATA